MEVPNLETSTFGGPKPGTSTFGGPKPGNFNVWRSQTWKLQRLEVPNLETSTFGGPKPGNFNVWRSQTWKLQRLEVPNLELQRLEVPNLETSTFGGPKPGNFNVWRSQTWKLQRLEVSNLQPDSVLGHASFGGSWFDLGRVLINFSSMLVTASFRSHWGVVLLRSTFAGVDLFHACMPLLVFTAHQNPPRVGGRGVDNPKP